MKTGAIVLAAGDGKRMKSANPKVMCEVLEKPMIGWVLDSLCEADFTADSIGVVVGNGAEIVEKYLNGREITRTFLQAERKGTGHAVMQAEKMLEDCENVLILCGDAPFMDAETIKKSLEFHLAEGCAVTVVTARIDNPTGYGRIIRDEKGEMVVSKLNESMLEEIASTTDAAYVRASKQSIGLDEIVQKINEMEKGEMTTLRFEEYNEQFHYLLWIAIALLLAEFLLLDRKNPLLSRFNIFEK